MRYNSHLRPHRSNLMSANTERPSYDPSAKMTLTGFIKQAVAEIRYDFANKK